MADSHFAAGICWKVEDGVRKYLVIDYYLSQDDLKAGRNAQVKFPGGTNKEFPGESLPDTLNREYVGETGLRVPASPLRVWVSDPSTRDGVTHTKHFFLFCFDKCRGTMRTEVLNDNGDWLSPPYWIEEEKLSRSIFYSHKPALRAAVERLDK